MDDPIHISDSSHHKPRGSGKGARIHSCLEAWRSSGIHFRVRHTAITQGHTQLQPRTGQPPHTWSGKQGVDSWRETESRSLAALEAILHVITAVRRQKCASLGHQEVSVHPTSSSNWAFLPQSKRPPQHPQSDEGDASPAIRSPDNTCSQGQALAPTKTISQGKECLENLADLYPRPKKQT